MNPDLAEEIDQLTATLAGVEKVLDLPAMRERITELEAEASVPNLWDDPGRAQLVTSKLSGLQSELRKVESLTTRMGDLPVMFELAEAEGDAEALTEAETELVALRQAVAALEVRTLLS
ncbi:MAG: peptide chain release factor 2, partial [Actinomycetota bacterium]|nr:peptide chain release factor 2 [Actinomycetota bacterium]